MRHGHGLRKLNRTTSHRLAMFRNMANVAADARGDHHHAAQGEGAAPRRRADDHASARPPTLANRRLAYDRLRDRDMVAKLFGELGPRYAKRNGGYLRILKSGFRKGDNAPMALVTLMDRSGNRCAAGRRQEEREEGSSQSCLIGNGAAGRLR